ncbi:MAG: THUMP domain-containing protein [Candidatus Bathyarchaeia archaeon]
MRLIPLIFTCPPGIEDIVELELRETFGDIHVDRAPDGVEGRVLADIPEDEISRIYSMRSIHHVMMKLRSFQLDTDGDPLSQIYEEIRDANLSPILPREGKFRITTERIGVHEFTSIDVQRVAGQAVVDRYGNRVDLENYDVEIRVDVIRETCLVGVSLTRESLHRRGYRVFEHPAALKPTIAYAMIRLGRPEAGMTLVDPMCGGGTIPIEAALFMGDKLKIYGLDIEESFIKGARRNSEAAGVEGLITLIKGDCRFLSRFVKNVDLMVTNPPYGVRMEPRFSIGKLYHAFAREAYRAMRVGGRLVVITLRGRRMEGALQEAGFSITHKRPVLHGDIKVKVIVAER